MIFKLRPYQQEAADKAVWHLKNYGKPFVVQAATGAGKSLIIADICHRLNEPVLVLQPSKEILEQNFAKLLSYTEHSDLIDEKDLAIYSASKKSKVVGKYTYATIGSIYKKPELFKHFRYVVIDECHQVNPKNLGGMYTTFLNAIKCKNVCGLTATPYRLVPKFVTEESQLFYTATLQMINRIHPFFFKKIVYKIETQDLIDQKFLCPIDYFADDADLSELVVNTTGADFTEDSLERFWNDKRTLRTIQAIEYAAKHHKKTLVFCSSLRHANRVLSYFEGGRAAVQLVDGTTPADEREMAIAAFKSGEKPVMLNVGVFTVGFDVPELDCIIMARPTMSLALYYQMVGRGVRIAPGKKILTVYDLAGVVERLGRVETIRVVKEDNGFKDMVMSEVGRMDNCALFRFHVKRDVFKKKGSNDDKN